MSDKQNDCKEQFEKKNDSKEQPEKQNDSKELPDMKNKNIGFSNLGDSQCPLSQILNIYFQSVTQTTEENALDFVLSGLRANSKTLVRRIDRTIATFSEVCIAFDNLLKQLRTLLSICDDKERDSFDRIKWTYFSDKTEQQLMMEFLKDAIKFVKKIKASVSPVGNRGDWDDKTFSASFLEKLGKMKDTFFYKALGEKDTALSILFRIRMFKKTLISDDQAALFFCSLKLIISAYRVSANPQ